MKPTNFEGMNVTYAKDQPEYQPLPAFKANGDDAGRMICCWRLSFIERVKLLFTGHIWQQVLTFNKPLQPQYLSVERPAVTVTAGVKLDPTVITAIKAAQKRRLSLLDLAGGDPAVAEELSGMNRKA